MPTLKELDSGQLKFMWNFTKMGEQKSSPEDVKRLKNNLDDLRQILIQKTGGQEQYKKSSDVPMEDAGTIVNFVCQKCEADVCFYGAEYEPKATTAWNRRNDNE